MKKNLGLVLSGGGARGAYQAGYLNQLSKILKEEFGVEKNPFSHISGSSVGALNGAYLTCFALDGLTFEQQTQNLCEVWLHLHSGRIFQNRSAALVQNGVEWIAQLASFGRYKKDQNISMLDASPLRSLLQEILDFSEMRKVIQSEEIRSFSVASFDYNDRVSTHFFESKDDISPWTELGQRGIKSYLNWKHILASASIPMLFDSVNIYGRPFGDGNLGDLNPFGPIQRMGAEHLFLIGIRNARHYLLDRGHSAVSPSIAGLLTTQFDMLFNAPFEHKAIELKKTFKGQFFFANPVGNIDQIAGENIDLMPSTVRLFMKGLGQHADICELSSYILFEAQYLEQLIFMGRRDAETSRQEIKGFFQKSLPRHSSAA